MKTQADKDGLINYRTEDGGLIIDRKTHVQAFRTTPGLAIMALELPARWYEGQTMIVEEQEKFKEEVGGAGWERGIKVRFAAQSIEKMGNQTQPKRAEL